MGRDFRVWNLRVAVIGGLLLAWEAVTGGLGLGIQLFHPAILPAPSAIWESLGGYVSSDLFPRDIRQTLYSAFSGLLLGILLGVFTGVLFGYVPVLAAVLEPVMVAFNSLPRIAVAPVLVLWFGLGTLSKISLAFFTVFFVIFFNTFNGVRTVDPDLVRAVRVMGGGPVDVARMVIIPVVTSWVFAALRTSVGFALSGAVVGEFVGSTAGLGYRMNIASGTLQTARVFAILFLLMLVSSTLIELARRAEVRLLRWRPPLAQV